MRNNNEIWSNAENKSHRLTNQAQMHLSISTNSYLKSSNKNEQKCDLHNQLFYSNTSDKTWRPCLSSPAMINMKVESHYRHILAPLKITLTAEHFEWISQRLEAVSKAYIKEITLSCKSYVLIIIYILEYCEWNFNLIIFFITFCESLGGAHFSRDIKCFYKFLMQFSYSPFLFMHWYQYIFKLHP